MQMRQRRKPSSRTKRRCVGHQFVQHGLRHHQQLWIRGTNHIVRVNANSPIHLSKKQQAFGKKKIPNTTIAHIKLQRSQSLKLPQPFRFRHINVPAFSELALKKKATFFPFLKPIPIHGSLSRKGEKLLR